MVARIGRAPVAENLDKPSRIDLRLGKAFGNEPEAEPVDRHVADLGDAVAGHLAIDPYPQLLPVFLELPGVKPALRRQSEIDAVVMGQVLRHDGRRVATEIVRRTDDDHPLVGADANGDHSLRHDLAKTDARVEALGDDVGETVVDDELDLDVGIVVQHLAELRPEDVVDGKILGGDADRPGRSFTACRSGRRARPRSLRSAARWW